MNAPPALGKCSPAIRFVVLVAALMLPGLFDSNAQTAQPANEPYGSIGGLVACDANHDGMQRSGEPELQRVTATITGNGVTLTTITDTNSDLGISQTYLDEGQRQFGFKHHLVFMTISFGAKCNLSLLAANTGSRIEQASGRTATLPASAGRSRYL